jgi:formate-dependent nitrite reductase cytochrome c552 subunit
MDAPPFEDSDEDNQYIIDDWLTTTHAQAGVNCRDCHQQSDHAEATSSQPSEKKWKNWTDAVEVEYTVCQGCHTPQAEGFLAGRHGMRLAQNLPPMRPELARQPMKPSAHGRDLTCVSCHPAHRFDTQYAAVEACLACHDDAHTVAYTSSAHFQLWQQERSGGLPPGAGVSCATCHLPREIHQVGGAATILVQHNQNGNLRPNEKMIRSVCMQCHGLGFSIDALADPGLIKRNFTGQPSVHSTSLEMAEQRQTETSRSH